MTQTVTNGIDTTRVEQFGGRMAEVLNHGALALMISIGHRTGIFDAMAGMTPATSEAIAREADLNERYVREWLGAMVTGNIVEHDPATGHYALPREHAALLTRGSGSDNFAVTFQYLPMLGAVEDKIVDCFKHGGGVPYTEFRRFHEIMAEESGLTVLSSLVQNILPLAPGIVERLEQGIDVLDVGCGRAKALNLMARTFPNSRFHGADLSLEAIEAGRQEAREHGSTNLHLEALDATGMSYEQRFDLVTAFDAIHDQARPDIVLANIRRALKPGGVFLMQDIKASSHVHENQGGVLAPFIYTISCLHCMTVSLAQGGMGLGAAWGKQKAVAMLKEAGFDHVDVTELEHDMQNYYYLAR